MRTRLLLLLLILTQVGLLRGAESAIAVFAPAVEGAGDAIPVAAALVDGMQARLADRGIPVVERERIAAALAEQSLGASGLIDAATAARFGKLLQADVLVVGSVRRSEALIVVTLRAVRAADGAVVWAGSVDGAAGELAQQAAGLADSLIAARSSQPAAVTGERVDLTRAHGSPRSCTPWSRRAPSLDRQ